MEFLRCVYIMEYKPFAFPPNYELAKLHSQASRPGQPDTGLPYCPCCRQRPKLPNRSWFRRSVSEDFQKDGGAITIYFELLRFYAGSILLIILLYSIMLLFQSYRYCEEKHQKQTSCVFKFGLWIVGSQDVIFPIHDESRGIILRVLRSCVFFILLFLNAYLLVKIQRHTIAQEDKSIEAYALLFKYIDKEWMEGELRDVLMKTCPGVEIHQLFFLNKTDKYKRYFDLRNQEYFKIKQKFADLKEKKKSTDKKSDQALSRHDSNLSQGSHMSSKSSKKDQRIKNKMNELDDKEFKELHQLVSKQKRLQSVVSQLTQSTGKAIVMFTKIKDRNKVLKHYKKNGCYGFLNLLGVKLKRGMYAQQMPSPNEIYWNYIGESQRKKVGMIILEYVTIVGALALSYLLLSKGLDESNRITADQQQQDEGKVVNSMLVAIGVVFLGIFFRRLMGIIAQWRKPETRTTKGLFIVATSIIFHLVYYAIIPTIYFSAYSDSRRSLKLLSIGIQVIFFLLIQFILSAFDIIYCFWNRKKDRILAAQKPVYCQKQLHEKVTFPTFPLEFKLMLLFKSWTFVLFYAFELPYILILILILFVYLYISDKHSVYTHYRPEHVGCRIQYTFLKIYSNFFTLYLCFFYCWAQHELYELSVAIIISVIFIGYQIFNTTVKKPVERQGDITQVEEENDSYREAYEKYLKTLNDEDLENQIKEFLDVYYEEDKSEYTSSSETLKRRADSLIVSDSVTDMSEHLLRKNTEN